MGDGQIPHVKELEVHEIKKCLKEAGLDDAKLTYVIVSKRISTKFFKGNDNPLSGKFGRDFDTLYLLH